MGCFSCNQVTYCKLFDGPMTEWLRFLLRSEVLGPIPVSGRDYMWMFPLGGSVFPTTKKGLPWK